MRIQKELAALKRAFNPALQAGRLTTKPHIPSVNVSNTREEFVTTGEVEAIREELSDELEPIVRSAVPTGWREGEILPLRWRQVDFEAGEVRLESGTTKNDEGRMFPLSTFPALEELLRRQRKRTDAVEKRQDRIAPWVFHRGGDRIKSMIDAWRGACKRAGLEGAWFHDLRRTAVRNLERASVPRSVAMKLTGHKTESVHRRYAIADEAALREGAEKLARLHQEEPQERSAIPIEQARDGS